MLIKTHKKETLSIRDLLMLDTTDEEYYEQTIYEKCFFKALYKMTVSEWITICRLFPEYNPPSSLPITEIIDKAGSSTKSNDSVVDNTDYSEWIVSYELPF